MIKKTHMEDKKENVGYQKIITYFLIGIVFAVLVFSITQTFAIGSINSGTVSAVVQSSGMVGGC